MKAATIVGILLLIVGIVALAYQGFTVKESEKIVDLGPIEASKETTRHIPLPPILGALALIGGVALVIAGTRRT